MMDKSLSHTIGQCSAENQSPASLYPAWHWFTGATIVIGLLSIPVFRGLWTLWHGDQNCGGLSFIPFLCAVIVNRYKMEFAQCRLQPQKYIVCLLPTPLTAMIVASHYGFPRIAGLLLVVSLLMASLGILGLSNYKLFLGPCVFLLLMVPPPPWIIDLVTLTLQKLLSVIFEVVFTNFSRRFIARHEFKLWFTGINYAMSINPECSGFRSLLGLIIISSFFAIFDRNSIAAVFLIISSGIIIALGLNFLRILILILLRLNEFEEYSTGPWHGLLGIGIILIGVWILSKLSRSLK